jgi:hypothetical protein
MHLRQLLRGARLPIIAAAAVSCSDPGPKPATITANSAVEQSATVKTVVAQAPSVKVADDAGNPFPGAVITFAVTAGGGSLVVATDTTNDQGIASSGSWLLGTTAGANTLTATAEGIPGSPVTFTATGTAGPATQMAAHAGIDQSGIAGSATAVAPAVIVKDAFGNPVAATAVTFTVSAGGGSLTGAMTTTDANGIAAVGSWTLGTTAGTNTLTASAVGAAIVSFTATGQVGPASRITIATQPAFAATGSPFFRQPVARITDANGNLVTSAATSVTAAIATGPGTLSGTTTVSTTSGVATFTNLTITGTGATTLSFTASGLTGATSSSFTVTPPPGPAAKLGFDTQPSGATSAVVLTSQPVISVQDANGALVFSSSATVTASIGSGTGTLSGTTSVTAVNGVATFTNLRINGSGNSTITFSATGLTSATSGNIPVAAPVAKAATLTAGDRQAVMAGGAIATKPSVQVFGQNNAPLAGVRVEFTITGGGGAITGGSAITDASGIATLGGWTVGATAGLNTLRATVEGSDVTGSPMVFSASGCSGGGGAGYKLTLCFTSEMTDVQKAAFTTAAARWEGIITGDLANVQLGTEVTGSSCGGAAFALASGTVVDDLLIYAAVVPIDGAGAVLGSAGPCFLRDSDNMSVIGSMRFDVADMNTMQGNGTLNAVILHEMGHVLGIGSLWNLFGFLQLPSAGGATSTTDTHFNGPNAIEAFNAMGFASYTGNKVPVENTGGPGTANGHWRDIVLGNELMTGFINNGSNPLSILTIRSLQDLKYTVDVNAADSFGAALALRKSPLESGRTLIRMQDDMYAGPVYTIDSRGRIVRRIR